MNVMEASNLIVLHVIPKSSRNEIIGWLKDADGQPVLKVKITAPPEDGKANKALLKFLAEKWDVPVAALELSSGAASRHKRLNVKSEALLLQLTKQRESQQSD